MADRRQAFQLLDAYGRPIQRRAWRAGGRSFFGAGGFDGARSNSQQTADWSTLPVAAGREALDRSALAARARDLVRNNGIAAGALQSLRAQVVGTGLRFRSTPDADALGVDPREALAFGRQIERELRLWGWSRDRHCDIARESTWGEMQGILWSDRVQAGDNLAVLRWQPDRGTRYATCVQLIDPERLANENDAADLPLQRQGVTYSEDGEPLDYAIRDAHPFDAVQLSEGSFSWTVLPRFEVLEDGTRRRVVVHGYTADRSEQGRGITAFAPIMKAFRDVDRLAEAEIGAAVINALLTAFVKSDFDPTRLVESLDLVESEVAEMTGELSALRDRYGDLKINGNRITQLAIGDEVQVPNTARQTQPYSDFKKKFLQDFAVGLGLDYPTLAQDWEGVNYSSARAALNQSWRNILDARDKLASDTIDPVEEAVVQEAFWRGYLTPPEGFPPFEGNETAYLRGSRLGPGRGYVDPVKEAQADEIRVRTGMASRSQLAAERGQDFEETVAQMAVDRETMERHSFAEPQLGEILTARGREDDDA